MLDFLMAWYPVIIVGCAGASLGQEYSFENPTRNQWAWMAGGFVAGAIAFYALVFSATGGKL
jgi:hypothetical protein